MVLPGEDMAQMNFDDRRTDRLYRISQSDRRMGVTARIDHYPVRFPIRPLKRIDQISLVIGLDRFDILIGELRSELLDDPFEAFVAVIGGVPLP